MAGISSLFHRYPTRAGRIFVLSSYELTRWREGMSAPELHRLVAAVAPWKREQVIIPINKGNAHWTVAVAWPQSGLIEMFDSFASKATMRAQAHVSRARAKRFVTNPICRPSPCTSRQSPPTRAAWTRPYPQRRSGCGRPSWYVAVLDHIVADTVTPCRTGQSRATLLTAGRGCWQSLRHGSTVSAALGSERTSAGTFVDTSRPWCTTTAMNRDHATSTRQPLLCDCPANPCHPCATEGR